jgi:hypothetical protein
MNGNIFNHSLASERYSWNGKSAYAIPPNPPVSKNTITEEPIFVKSYINAYNTAFNQPANRRYALNKYYQQFGSNEIDSNFIKGTFGYYERYISNLQSPLVIKQLIDDLSMYFGTPYLFISAGSGGGSGFMYLNWVIVTYGVPYVISVS